MIRIVQDIAAVFVVRLVNIDDNETPLTGKTAAMRISKNGGTFAAPDGLANEIGSGGDAEAGGFYAVSLTADDTDTVGPLAVAVWANDDTSNVYADVPFYVYADLDAGASDIDAATANKIADHVIRRDYENVCNSTDGDTLQHRSVSGVIADLVAKNSQNGTAVTLYEDDDTTVLGTLTLSTSGTPTSNPVTGQS